MLLPKDLLNQIATFSLETAAGVLTIFMTYTQKASFLLDAWKNVLPNPPFNISFAKLDGFDPDGILDQIMWHLFYVLVSLTLTLPSG